MGSTISRKTTRTKGASSTSDIVDALVCFLPSSESARNVSRGPGHGDPA